MRKEFTSGDIGDGLGHEQFGGLRNMVGDVGSYKTSGGTSGSSGEGQRIPATWWVTKDWGIPRVDESAPLPPGNTRPPATWWKTKDWGIDPGYASPANKSEE